MHIQIVLTDKRQPLSKYQRMQGEKQSQQILASQVRVKFLEVCDLFEAVQSPSLVLLLFKTLFLKKQLELLKHLQFYYSMERITQLFNQGRLLFVPKAHPKYTNNQLRVFKPSIVLQIALGLTGIYAVYFAFGIGQQKEIEIEYPSQERVEGK